MTNITFIKFLIPLIFFVSRHPTNLGNFSRQHDPFKKIKTSTMFDINSITDIEIKNTWTNNSYHLNPLALKKLKKILSESTGNNSLFLKPGHLFMSIRSNKRGVLDHYEVYMYNSSILFDPYLDGKLEPAHPYFTISLKHSIDWDNLNK